MTPDRFLSVFPEAEPEMIARAMGFYTEKRLNHVLGCCQEACRLSCFMGVDTNQAFTAALLHDMTKKLSFEKQLQLCDKYDIVDKVFLEKAPAVLHAYTGAGLARAEFNVSEEIADAIRYHTGGRAGMSSLEKLVFLADIIEPGRDFEGVEELRKAAYENPDYAMLLALKSTVDHVKRQGNTVFYRSLEALEYFENQFKLQ